MVEKASKEELERLLSQISKTQRNLPLMSKSQVIDLTTQLENWLGKIDGIQF